MLNKLKEKIRTFLSDDSGEIPIGPLLIIALIIVPLVLLLVYFRDNLVEFFTNAIENLFGESESGETVTAPSL